jgi:CII-binding regulator of phage lambda lysogenization HflD
VSQKADVTSIELFNTSINLQELAEEVFAEHGNNLQAGLDALLKSLEEKAKQGEEIF